MPDTTVEEVSESDECDPSIISSIFAKSVNVVEARPARDRQAAREDLEEYVQLVFRLEQPRVLNYLAPLKTYWQEKLYRLQLPALDDFRTTNLVTKQYHMRIQDISGFEHYFDLASAGFEFAMCSVTVAEWTDEYTTDVYIPAMKEWLTQYLGCESAFIYSYNFRHTQEGHFVPVHRPWVHYIHPEFGSGHSTSRTNGGDAANNSSWVQSLLSMDKDGPYHGIAGVAADPAGPTSWKRPFNRVHCDASTSTPINRLPLYFPDTYEQLLKSRVRLLSIWRSISPPPQDTPLAFLDARTLNNEDLVPMDIVYPHFVDQAYEVLHNDRHRWFYKRDMQQEDVVIFKLHDSSSDEAKVCPHSAFIDPSVTGDAPKRASLEIKVMVFG